MKVAIFEDEFLLANDLKTQIQRFEYEVVALFRNAEEGIQAFREISNPSDLPELVMMDITLAGKMSGIEAARIISEEFGMAIVFLSGMSQMEVIEEAFRNKPHAFLIKPFEIQQALVSIRLAVYQRSLERQLSGCRENDNSEKFINRNG